MLIRAIRGQTSPVQNGASAVEAVDEEVEGEQRRGWHLDFYITLIPRLTPTGVKAYPQT